MRITALQPQATDAERINVFVDGHFLLGARALIVYQMGLTVEQELTPEQLEQLRSEEALQQAVDRALHYLSFRPHSRQEVRSYLRRKAVAPELIDAVISRLEQLELINDADFATFWVETRDQFSPRGFHALKHELRQKGIKADVVDELINDEQDEERALTAGRKKALALVRLPEMDYATFYRRLGSFLQRRGFGYQIATHTVKALWQELQEEEPEDDSTE